jgi:hypothetical protein
MEILISSGRIADFVLGLVLIEAVALFAYHRLGGRGVSPVELLANLAAGGSLLLALRGALVDAWWGWIAAALAGALVAHVADLILRWRRY